MWTCPKCGARFVNRNQRHSCGRATLDQWLDGLGPDGLALYRRFAALVGACGEFHVAPAGSRIAFLGQVRFASITRLRDDGMVCTFALPARPRERLGLADRPDEHLVAALAGRSWPSAATRRSCGQRCSRVTWGAG